METVMEVVVRRGAHRLRQSLPCIFCRQRRHACANRIAVGEAKLRRSKDRSPISVPFYIVNPLLASIQLTQIWLKLWAALDSTIITPPRVHPTTEHLEIFFLVFPQALS